MSRDKTKGGMRTYLLVDAAAEACSQIGRAGIGRNVGERGQEIRLGAEGEVMDEWSVCIFTRSGGEGSIVECGMVELRSWEVKGCGVER